uniref:MAM domain-containing protein n=1 Tax=Ciona savignyi TaxID=51511 RepID=H2Z951_CIOSA
NQPTWTDVKVPLNVGANPITFTFKVDTTNADVQLDGITVQPLNTCPVPTTTIAPITSTTAPTPITTTLKTSSGVVVVTGGEPRIPSDKNTTNIPTTTFPTTTTQTEQCLVLLSGGF